MATYANTAVKPRAGFPLSRQKLRDSMGYGKLYDFLNLYATRDTVSFFDDFTGKTLDTTNTWAVANSGGTGVSNFATAVALNGTAAGATGTTSGGSISLIGPIMYSGAQNSGMEIRVKMGAAATSYNLEVGFIDAVPGSNTGGINSIDTPSVYMANGALIALNTSNTIATLASCSVGTAAGQAVFATTFASPAPTVLTAATYMTFRIQIVNNVVYFFADGVLAATHTALQGVNPATLLAPWVYAKTNTTTTKTITIDYIRVWSDRV